MSLGGLMGRGSELLNWETGSPWWRLRGWSGHESYDRNGMAERDLDCQSAFFSLLKAALTVGEAEALESDQLGVQSRCCRFLAVFPGQIRQIAKPL